MVPTEAAIFLMYSGCLTCGCHWSWYCTTCSAIPQLLSNVPHFPHRLLMHILKVARPVDKGVFHAGLLRRVSPAPIPPHHYTPGLVCSCLPTSLTDWVDAGASVAKHFFVRFIVEQIELKPLISGPSLRLRHQNDRNYV